MYDEVYVDKKGPNALKEKIDGYEKDLKAAKLHHEEVLLGYYNRVRRIFRNAVVQIGILHTQLWRIKVFHEKGLWWFSPAHLSTNCFAGSFHLV